MHDCKERYGKERGKACEELTIEEQKESETQCMVRMSSTKPRRGVCEGEVNETWASGV